MTVRLKSLICFIVVMFVILGHAITLNIQSVYASENDNFIEYLPNQTGKYKAIVYVKDTEGNIKSKCSDECIIYFDVNSLVKPHVVIATLSENCKGFEKGDKVL